jgi:hypothetical protein
MPLCLSQSCCRQQNLAQTEYEKSILRRALKRPMNGNTGAANKGAPRVEDVSIYINRQRHGIVALP